MINPDYLKTFLTLLELGHFTKTAQKLHMTQPGVSQHVRKLEDHFGVNLINRKGKSFTVTESGLSLKEYGKQLFQDYEVLKTTVGVDNPHLGICRLSSPGSFGLKLFDSLLELARIYPGLNPFLTIAPNSSIPLQILSREVDVGFMTKRIEDPMLESEKFSEESLLVIVPKKSNVKSLADLKKLGFVNHPDGFYFAERVLGANFPKEFISTAQIPCRVFINQISRILDPVALGLGFTVLPEGAYQNYNNKQQLKILNIKIKVADEIFKVQRRNEKLPSRYQIIENLIRDKS